MSSTWNMLPPLLELGNSDLSLKIQSQLIFSRATSPNTQAGLRAHLWWWCPEALSLLLSLYHSVIATMTLCNKPPQNAAVYMSTFIVRFTSLWVRGGGCSTCLILGSRLHGQWKPRALQGQRSELPQRQGKNTWCLLSPKFKGHTL